MEPISEGELWFLPERAWVDAMIDSDADPDSTPPSQRYVSAETHYPSEAPRSMKRHRCKLCGRMIVFVTCLVCHPGSRRCGFREEAEIVLGADEVADIEARIREAHEEMDRRRRECGDKKVSMRRISP